MLFQKVYHALDFVDEDLNLWSEFFVVRDDFHDFSQQNLVIGVVVGVDRDSVFGVLVEVLKVGQNYFDLVQ